MEPFRNLTETEIRKIKAKIGSPKCRFCNCEMEVWKHMTVTPYISPENQMYITAGDVFVSLVCPCCGSTELFRADVILK